MSEAKAKADAPTAQQEDAQQPEGVQGYLELLGIDPRLLGMFGALALIWLGFHLFTDGAFLSARNLWNLAVQTSVVATIATGMVLVIITREIDLSVGSLLGFLGMVMAVLQTNLPESNWAWLLALALGIGLGGVIGAFQGYWTAYRAVPSFIVTLAGLLIWRGGAWLVTQGRTVAPLDERFQVLGGGITGAIGSTWSWALGGLAILCIAGFTLRTRRRRQTLNFPTKPLWAELVTPLLLSGLVVAFVVTMNAYTLPQSEVGRGIPVPVLLLIGVTLLMSALARLTAFGRYVYAIGGNPEAAELAGIDTRRIKLLVFVIIGMLCAVAGAVASARLNAGSNSTGELAELYVIAAAVVGGTSLTGGVGTVIGAVLGALIMQSLQNGMVLIGLTSALQQVIIGLVLILAVWLDIAYRRRSGRAM